MTARSPAPLSGADPWRWLVAAWRRLPPASPMALDVAANSREWGAALDLMDRSGRLTRTETNKLLDTVLLQLDAEREAAGRALRARIERSRRGR